MGILTVFSNILLDVGVEFSAFGDGQEEDEAFEVCISLTRATEVEVMVTLSAQEGDQLPLDTRATGTYTYPFFTIA